MEEKRTSVFSNVLVWFGAGVSIAEIITGTYFAPLGFKKGMLAILIGHIIGGFIMYGAGIISGRERKCAMETVGRSFGFVGCKFFALLNVIQLIGWTSIMIYDGALAANRVFDTGLWVWALVIGILILVWIFIGLTNLGKVNVFAMGALLILTLIMAKVVFTGDAVSTQAQEAIGFGGAVELAVAMPLSWLPLIGDYTCNAKKPGKTTFASVLTYGIVSMFMYTIGMGASIFTGETDIAEIMVKAGLGVVGLLIIVFSTVTTAFLDVYSAGISAETISKKLKEKPVSIAVTIIGIAAAIFFTPDNITDFLYYIGSVFAPMTAILIADYFMYKKPAFKAEVNILNFILWVMGFVVYRQLMVLETPIGITLIDMVLTYLLGWVLNRCFPWGLGPQTPRSERKKKVHKGKIDE